MVAEQAIAGTNVGDAFEAVCHQIAAVADVINSLPAYTGDYPGGRNLQPIKNCLLKCVGDVLWLIAPGHPLVEVAKQDEMLGLGRQICRQTVEVGKVILPCCPVAAAATHMCFRPWDTDPDSMHVTKGRLCNAGHKSSWWQLRLTNDIHVAPRVSAPEKYFPAPLNERIPIIGDGRDDMSDVAKEILIRLREANDIRHQRQQPFLDDSSIQ